MDRGLRQDDPLSPLLFIIVTQVLHVLLQKALSLGIIEEVKICTDGYISHLQFADDTIIFINDTWHSIKGIKIVLTIFELLSGLKINYNKSFIYAPSSPPVLARSWASWLKCEADSIPFMHLGAFIGASCKKKHFWKPLTKKITTSLSKWRCNTLLKPGRLIMINAVLDALPVYWMTLFNFPKGIIEDIERVKRRFYWIEIGESNGSIRKMHSISWNKICKHKNERGLGIKQLMKKNLSMLAKWWWRGKTEACRLCYNISRTFKKIKVTLY